MASYPNMYYRGTEEKIRSSAVQNGKIKVATDTGRLYIDFTDIGRIEITDFVRGYTSTNIESGSITNPIPSKIYIASDTGHLYVYLNGEFVDVSGSGGGGPISYPIAIDKGGTGNTVGYIQTGRLSGSTIGDYATVEGYNNTASGLGSHSEGYGATAIIDQGGLPNKDHDYYFDSMSTSGDLIECDYSEDIYSQSVFTNDIFMVGLQVRNTINGRILWRGSYSIGANATSRADYIGSITSGSGELSDDSEEELVSDDPMGGFSQDHSSGSFLIYQNTDIKIELQEMYFRQILDQSEVKIIFNMYRLAAFDQEKYILETQFNRVPDEIVYGVSGSLASGKSSHAEGTSTTAQGESSHAEGNKTYAKNDNSHAEGIQTTAGGNNGSHAEGYLTCATGISSHAEGDNTRATGDYSHAEGEYPVASGNRSHAEGFHTTASKNSSHAEGYQTWSTGDASHTEGYLTCAFSTGSHSEGYITYAGSIGSHTEGYRTRTTGDYSHAEGSYTCAAGQYSHAEGYETCATGTNGSHAEGSETCATGRASHAEGYSTYATGYFSHAEGSSTTASDYASHAEGFVTCASGNNASHAEGYLTCASGTNGSHAEGYKTRAIGTYGAHAEGEGTTAFARGSHAEGFYTCAGGAYSHAEGRDTTASGYNSHTEGYLTCADGFYSHAEGYQTCAAGESSHASGYGTCAGEDYQFVLGRYNNNKTDTIFEIGNGAENNARSNIFEVFKDHINILGDIYQNGTKRTFSQPLSIIASTNANNVNFISLTSSTAIPEGVSFYIVYVRDWQYGGTGFEFGVISGKPNSSSDKSADVLPIIPYVMHDAHQNHSTPQSINNREISDDRMTLSFRFSGYGSYVWLFAFKFNI